MAKLHKCDVCSYTSNKSEYLKLHMRTHTGEKPYKCTLCTFASAQLANLQHHSRIHTGEKPYKCRYCSYASTQMANLQMHLRTHTGEKPYKCNQCSYASAQLANLQSHMRTHTDETIYQCSECSYTGPNMCHFLRHKPSGSKNVRPSISSPKTLNPMSVSYYWHPRAMSLGVQEESTQMEDNIHGSNSATGVGSELNDTVNGNVQDTDDVDEEQTNQSAHNHRKVGNKHTEMIKLGELSCEVIYTEAGHFDFDDGMEKEDGNAEERRGSQRDDICSIQ